jgi:ATPase subunit of ABC transporter with duplicated ATPase domains
MFTVWTGKRQACEQAVVAANAAANDAASAAISERFSVAEAKLPGVVAECDRLNSEYGENSTIYQQFNADATRLEADIRGRRAVYDLAKARVDGIRAQLDSAIASKTEINFNNELLKRVRAARPVIANKLWSMVLAAVSRSFSQMRGLESVVTKDADGFKVNGQAIESLSGSTLDILGLSIRLALVRTFLPQSPFLILDEPSAACDADRTAAMLGFLVTSGFDQMLVVTHEDTTEQTASALIEI